MTRNPIDAFRAWLIVGNLRRLQAWIRWRYLNPTRDWPARAIVSLEFDVDEVRLNGIRDGAPWQELSVFGPADAISYPLGRKHGPELAWSAIGLKAEAYEGRIVGFSVITDASARRNREYRQKGFGSVTLTGPTMPAFEISKATHERELFRVFGRPIESGPVAGEPMHTFLLPRSIVETFHDPQSGYVREVTLHERGNG